MLKADQFSTLPAVKANDCVTKTQEQTNSLLL